VTIKSSLVKPRLLVLTSTYPRWANDHEPGFVHELASRLTSDFDITVVCPHTSNAKEEEVLDGVRVRRFRYAPSRLEALVNDGGIVANLKRNPWKWLLLPGFMLGLLWFTWRAAVGFRPSVVHAHWLMPQGVAAALLRKVDRRMPPFVVTSHGADLFALRGWPMQRLKRWVVQNAAAVTVVSTAMHAELARIGAEVSKVQVQPMGVDLRERYTPDYTVHRSRDELLFVGRHFEKKGVRHLIDAMPSILRAHPKAFLTIAGFGPEENALRKQADSLGLWNQVHFLGAIPQSLLPTLYRRAALFVAPFVQAASGDREGLGLVSVEAAGCGCPVVVSDIPAVRDVFADGEATFVEPGNVNALADAIILRLASASFGSVSFSARFAATFDWQVVAGRYASILGESGVCCR
jgi:glycosyltransferase involved in cell wall biosynthesis